MKKTKKYGRFGFLARTVCTSALVLSLMSGCVFAETVEMSVPELLEPVGVEFDTATAYIGEIADTQVFEGEYIFGAISNSTSVGGILTLNPDVVDMNRMERGDYFQKPTAYWFWNCEHTNGFTYQNDKQKKTILNTKGSSKAGICSEDRSMISSDYARNWICDFVIGKTQNIGQLCFDFEE